MARRSPPTLIAAIGLTLCAYPGVAVAQTPSVEPERVSPLFATVEPLDLKITADFGALHGDRSASPDRPALLTVPHGDGTIDVGASVRTRGAFRLDPGNCSFPPLRLDVRGSEAGGTVLEGQDDLKLVSSCRPGRSAYEEMVLLEYLAYETFRRITDQSFRVRLVRLTLVDSSERSDPERRVGFLIEDADALAERWGATIFDLEEGKNLPASAFEAVSRTTTAVFQYMIGNSDWSDVAAHNVEILDRSGVAMVVPYDFDFSGLVDAPYASTPPELGLASVRERLYRGWCANDFVTMNVIERFRAARPGILALWTEATELSDRSRRIAIGYLEEFFASIETDARAERRFLRDCRQATD